MNTETEKKLQEIFDNIGHLQDDIVLSPLLGDIYKRSRYLKAVYKRLEEALELMKKVKLLY